MEISEVGVRRPTTGFATACVWGFAPVDPLLDWLGVPRTHRTFRESVLDADRQSDLQGLVLLDLPDQDSTAVGHRLEVDRLIEMVDLVIWVLDPQKYADESLHAYLRHLVGRESTMLVVLNQLDRLSPQEAQTCATDLRRLLDADGLTSARLLGTSALQGDGVDAVRLAIADLVRRQDGFRYRVTLDLDEVTERLRAGLGVREADPDDLPGVDRLVAVLSQATGIDVLLDGVATDYRRRAAQQLGWPPARWVGRFRADPLRTAGLGVDEEDTVRGLTGSALHEPTPAQRARLDLGVREVVQAAVQDLPVRWVEAVSAAELPPTEELGRALDTSLAQVDLPLAVPGWWRAVRILQSGLIWLVLLGALWSLTLVVGRWIGTPLPSGPRPFGTPLPVLLSSAGLLVGGGLALLGRRLAVIGAGRRRAAMDRTIGAVVHQVAAEQVVAPLSVVLNDHRRAREALGGDGFRGLPPRAAGAL
jgi:hypothetical protein